MKRNNRLEAGLIPAFEECPYWKYCGMVRSCHHKGIKHPVAFSCGAARAYEYCDLTKLEENP